VKQIHLGYRERVNRDAIVALGITLAVIFAGSVLICIERVGQYLEYVESERV